MTTGLDINTPRGQVTLAQEARAIELFRSQYPQTTFVHTPKATAALVDGFMVRDAVAIGIAEFKCRSMSVDDFGRMFQSEWLITFEKLLSGRQMSDAMRIPFWGFLYLVPSDVLLMKKLYDPRDGWQVKFTVRKTNSQATCNGGVATRDNAYVDMTRAKALSGKSMEVA